MTIWNYSFRSCNEITDVEIGNNVTSIGASAFSNCDNLKTVVAGSGVANILSHAFSACSSLTGVYFKGDAPALPAREPWSVFLDSENATVYYLDGTSGWESTFGDVPTAIWVLEEPIMIISPAVVGSELSFVVKGSAGSVVIVEACSDLSDPVWSTVDTVTLTDGSATLTDPDPATLSARYYRVRAQ
jgi:hypothetical protein